MSDSQKQLEPVLSLMRERFIESSESKISSLDAGRWPEAEQKILELSKVLVNLNTWRGEDEQGSIFLNIGCMFLSAYRIMEPYFEHKNKLLDVVRVYLGDNIELDLLYQFCSLDYASTDEIEKYGIRFSRPTMLSEGGDLCRLQYFRI